jgi:hypothetical protein
MNLYENMHVVYSLFPVFNINNDLISNGNLPEETYVSLTLQYYINRDHVRLGQ